MAKNQLSIRVRVDGLEETLRALSTLPKEATAELRDKAEELSKSLATKAQSAGRAEGRQAAIVSATVRAQRDRVPVIVAGGAKRIGRNRKPAYKLLFGSEFGSSLPQYKPHIGTGSYWFFKTVEKNQSEIYQEWLKAADEVIKKFDS